MEYYEFTYIVKDLVEHIKTENKQNEGQNAAQTGMAAGMMSGMKMPNISMPKMPKM